jgi:hypothetical protein
VRARSTMTCACLAPSSTSLCTMPSIFLSSEVPRHWPRLVQRRHSRTGKGALHLL